MVQMCEEVYIPRKKTEHSLRPSGDLTYVALSHKCTRINVPESVI